MNNNNCRLTFSWPIKQLFTRFETKRLPVPDITISFNYMTCKAAELSNCFAEVRKLLKGRL